jgi:hypothetical protein
MAKTETNVVVRWPARSLDADSPSETRWHIEAFTGTRCRVPAET